MKKLSGLKIRNLLLLAIIIILVLYIIITYLKLDKEPVKIEAIESSIEQSIAENFTEKTKRENLDEPELEEEKDYFGNTIKNNNQDNSNQEIYSKELYDNIEISVEIQDIINKKQKIVVYIKNNNKDYAFSGVIKFYALSTNNDILCSDYIYVDDIPPSIKSWTILWGRPGLYNSYSATISEADFREVSAASNIEYEEIGITGLFVFIYTTSTDCSELQQIVDVYKNDRFKNKKVFELDFFNDREKAMDAFTNKDGIGFGMMLPVASYNYNANIGLDELKCHFKK